MLVEDETGGGDSIDAATKRWGIKAKLAGFLITVKCNFQNITLFQMI